MADIVNYGGSRSTAEYFALCLKRDEIKRKFYEQVNKKGNSNLHLKLSLNSADLGKVSARWDHYLCSRYPVTTTYVRILHLSYLIPKGDNVLPNRLRPRQYSGSKMLASLSGSTLTYNLIDAPSGVVPVTVVNPETDKLTEEWLNGPGRGSAMLENELYVKPFKGGEEPLYDPVAMKGIPIGVQIVGKSWEEEKVLAMMKVLDNALGRERGFGTPGTWEKRFSSRE